MAVVAASTLWSIATNMSSNVLVSGVTPLELAGTTTIIANLGLIALQLLQRQRIFKKLSPSKIVLGVLLVIVLGANSIVIAKLPVAIATVLISMAPCFVVLWSVLISGKRPSTKVVVVLAVSFVGVVLVSGIASGGLNLVKWDGIALGLTTAIFFAAYTVLSEQIAKTETLIDFLLEMFSIASLIWFGFLLTQGLSTQIWEMANVAKVIYIGLGGTLLPYLLFLYGVRHVQSQKAAIIVLIEPFIAGVIAWVWFGQHLTPLQIIGGLLIVGAIAYLQIGINN